MKKIIYIITFLVALSNLLGCIEPYNLNSEYFEENIVIEANITNKLEKQRIKVSKTYPIDSETYQPGGNAVSVKVKSEQGAEFTFSYQEEDSTYVSDEAFKAQPNILYTLEVATANDLYTANSYFENEVTLENIGIEKSTNKEGIEGLDITVNANSNSEDDKYYRYKYEETFTLTAPYYSPYKAILTEMPLGYGQFSFLDYLVIRAYDDTIYHRDCYRTEFHNKPILTTTQNLSEDDLSNFTISFIPKTNYKLNDRYTIKITQYAQSREAYTFYKILQELNYNEETLSPNQPGFVQGNIQSVNFPEKKVIGFFDIVSISSKRVFINRSDYYPNEPISEYFIECEVQDFWKLQPPGLVIEDRLNEGIRLVSIVQQNSLILYDYYGYYDNNIGYEYFLMVKPECGDCSVLGNPEPPSFWQE